MPVGGGCNRVSLWKGVVEKVQKKLSAWKARLLSFGGRLTLCKAVLGSLSNYMFSLYKAPAAIIRKLESIRCKFFWGGSVDNKKIAWVAWNKILNSKEKGGLGIGSLQSLNQALLVKWWWRWKQEDGTLWKDVIGGIHGPDGKLGRRSSAVNSRGVWGSIASLNRNLNMGNIDLRSLFYDSETGWEWGLENDGIFTVASCRQLLDSFLLQESDRGTYWNPLVPIKANILLWRVSLGRLPTRVNLKERGVDTRNTLCPLCNRNEETEEHIFGQCSFSREVLVHIRSWCDEFPADAALDKVKNVEVSQKQKGRRIRCILAAYIWNIWMHRNQLIFRGKVENCNVIAEKIKVTAFQWIRCRGRSFDNLSWDIWKVRA